MGVLVTVAYDGTLLDRRRVALLDDDLPKYPHHHEGQWALGRHLHLAGARRFGMDEIERLIERVRESATRHARECLDVLGAAVPGRIAAIALRESPELPPTLAERLSDHRGAQGVADAVMYREALAVAAEAKGWSVCRYRADTVLADAARARRVPSIDALLRDTGRAAGPPWQKDHQVAMAAAIAATPSLRRGRASSDAIRR